MATETGQTADQAAASEKAALAGTGANPVIMVADPDRRSARAIERRLHHSFAARGYRVTSVDSAQAAIDLARELRDRGESVAFVLADQAMPHMTGIELLCECRKLHPDLRAMLLAEHADLDLALAAVDDATVDYFLIKPWHTQKDLLPNIRDLLESWEVALERESAGLRILGKRDSVHGQRVRNFLERNTIHYRWVDVGGSEGRSLLERLPEEERHPQPVVILPDGTALPQPSNVELARSLGIATKPARGTYDLVIIGGGPAGLAAAVYGSSEGLTTMMVEREAPGGQAGQSAKIDNYLGFHAGLSGSELTRRAIIQARRFGAEIVRPREAIGLKAMNGKAVVELSDHSSVECSCALIATGVAWRRVGAPGVAGLLGRGVSYGAAPGEAPHCAQEEVFVIGGANSAGQAAVHFAKHAGRVTIVVRGDSLEAKMSRYLVDLIESTDNIEVRTGTELAEAHGSERLTAVSLVDRAGKRERLRAHALFILIGAVPHTDWLDDVVARDDRGFILCGRDLTAAGPRRHGWPLARDPYPLETSVPGVFAAGDVRHGSTKRVASAVGEGSMAIQLMHQYLADDG